MRSVVVVLIVSDYALYYGSWYSQLGLWNLRSSHYSERLAIPITSPEVRSATVS